MSVLWHSTRRKICLWLTLTLNVRRMGKWEASKKLVLLHLRQHFQVSPSDRENKQHFGRKNVDMMVRNFFFSSSYTSVFPYSSFFVPLSHPEDFWDVRYWRKLSQFEHFLSFKHETNYVTFLWYIRNNNSILLVMKSHDACALAPASYLGASGKCESGWLGDVSCFGEKTKERISNSVAPFYTGASRARTK